MLWKKRIWYYDAICTIIEGRNSGEMIVVYRHHWTPKPKDVEWIELQIKVIARRRWGNDWMARRIRHDHPRWEVAVMPNKEVKKKDRQYNQTERTKEIE